MHWSDFRYGVRFDQAEDWTRGREARPWLAEPSHRKAKARDRASHAGARQTPAAVVVNRGMDGRRRFSNEKILLALKYMIRSVNCLCWHKPASYCKRYLPANSFSNKYLLEHESVCQYVSKLRTTSPYCRSDYADPYRTVAGPCLFEYSNCLQFYTNTSIIVH